MHRSLVSASWAKFWIRSRWTTRSASRISRHLDAFQLSRSPLKIRRTAMLGRSSMPPVLSTSRKDWRSLPDRKEQRARMPSIHRASERALRIGPVGSSPASTGAADSTRHFFEAGKKRGSKPDVPSTNSILKGSHPAHREPRIYRPQTISTPRRAFVARSASPVHC